MKDYKLKEDEYADENGLPMCKKCKTKRYFTFEVEDGIKVVYSKCKCQEEEYKNNKKQRQEQKSSTLQRRTKMFRTWQKYLDARFGIAIITEHNKEAYKNV